MSTAFETLRPLRWMRAHRRELSLFLILSVAAALINVAAAFGAIRDRPLNEILRFSAGVLADTTMATVPMLFALTWAERLSVTGWRRHLVTVGAAAGTYLAVSVPTLYFQWPFPNSGLAFGVTASPLGLLLFGIWLNGALALLARAYIVKSNEEQAANARLTQIRGEQIAARRRLIEARLVAIQARIDPQFFFDMLDAVQRTYEVDVERAELLLDELIVFLRAALPRLRTTTSTIAQECELAKSYARLRTLARLSNAQFDSVIPAPLETATFPPGVLLPLVDGVLRSDASETVLLLTADMAANRVVLFLASSARPGADAVARVEATLAELFGDGAELTISSSPDRVVLTTVRVPYEPISA